VKKKRGVPMNSTPPKKGKGKRVRAGHNMGGAFASNPKMATPGTNPPDRAHEKRLRERRLHNKFI